MEEAVWIDKENVNNICKEAVDKDMTNISIVFNVRKEGESPPRGYKEMKSHMIFGVNLDAVFMSKYRCITDRQKADTPPSVIY